MIEQSGMAGGVMANGAWITTWIGLRFSDDVGERGYLRWYAPLGSDLVLVLPADDPILLHLGSGSHPVSIAPVVARGMKHSLRRYTPAIATSPGHAGLAEANKALRAKYRWRWVIQRSGRAVGRLLHGARSNDTVVRVELGQTAT
jgi:hypothetical protein